MASNYSITVVVGAGNPGHATIQLNGPDVTTFAGMGPSPGHIPFTGINLGLFDTHPNYDIVGKQPGQSPVGFGPEPSNEFSYVDASKYTVKSYTFEISKERYDAAHAAMTSYVNDNPNYNIFNGAICTDYVFYILHAALPGTNLSQLSRIPSLLMLQLDEASRNGGVITYQRGAGEDVTYDTGLGDFRPDANAPNFSPHQQFNEVDPGPFNYASGYIDLNGQSRQLVSFVRSGDDSGQLTSANGTVIDFGAGTISTFHQNNGVMTVGSPTTGAVGFISVDPITGIASISGGYQASAGSTISVASNSINVVQQQTTGTQTTTVNWQGELERITKLNNDLSSSIKEYDPKNTHPYNELDVAKGADSKVTGAQIVLDQNIINAGSAIGQIFGSTLGSALAGSGQIGQLVGGAAGGVIGSLIGQKFGLVVAASMAADLSKVSLADVFASQNLDIASAGIGAVSSFLTAELGSALKIGGFGEHLFNAAANGFTLSVLSQVSTKITAGATFEAAIAAIDWSGAVSGAIGSAALHVENFIGSFLGQLLVPAKSHAGAIGGQLLGAIGSFLLPGVGSLIGSILGTKIGDLFGNTSHPAATDLLDQAGDHYAATHYQTSSSDGGAFSVPDQLADPALAIINGYLSTVKGAALDHSKQVTIGYQTDPQSSYIVGVPSHPAAGVFFSTGYAVQAAAVDVLQHTEAIGGDLLLKRGHHNSSFYDPPPMPPADPSGDPGPTGAPIQPIATTQLAILSGDLGVAQDYENYLNNREAINALMAANTSMAGSRDSCRKAMFA